MIASGFHRVVFPVIFFSLLTVRGVKSGLGKGIQPNIASFLCSLPANLIISRKSLEVGSSFLVSGTADLLPQKLEMEKDVLGKKVAEIVCFFFVVLVFFLASYSEEN